MPKFKTRAEAISFERTFKAATNILAGNEYTFDYEQKRHVQVYPGRDWHTRLQGKYTLHPAVHDVVFRDDGYKPDDWHQLLLEWPHRSETDPNRLAYTPNERYAADDRQLITAIGKYLRRHFSDLPDHELRDIVARYTYAGTIVLSDNLNDFGHAVVNGPSSCMSKSFDIETECGETVHPYAVYDPAYGWRMAIRRNGNDIVGRCLVYAGDEYDGDGKGVFVRSYKRNEHGYSGCDEAIEAWLKNEGYEKSCSWPDGARLARYAVRRYSDHFVLPYIDGGTQSVKDRGSHLEIDSDGDIGANNTCGTASFKEMHTCACCGDRAVAEDGIWVGYHEDTFIGECCSDGYTRVYGRRGNEYYVPDEEAVYVGGEHYHCDYLSENNIVELASGDYCHMDDAVYIESSDEWYETDDSDICYAEDTGRYELRSDCWQDDDSERWYTDATEYVEVDGCKYHPDNAPETEDDETN